MQAWLRNGLLACLAACAAGFAASPSAYAAEPINLRWDQLAPPPPEATRELLTKITARRRVNQRVDACTKPRSDLVTVFSGERVKISGFIVPFNGDEPPLKSFVLIASAGGCVSFPPPRNKMILVTPKQALVLDSYFNLMDVTGVIRTKPAQTAIGEVGYQLAAETIEPPR
jgi:hypothetical protein